MMIFFLHSEDSLLVKLSAEQNEYTKPSLDIQGE